VAKRGSNEYRPQRTRSGTAERVCQPARFESGFVCVFKQHEATSRPLGALIILRFTATDRQQPSWPWRASLPVVNINKWHGGGLVIRRQLLNIPPLPSVDAVDDDRRRFDDTRHHLRRCRCRCRCRPLPVTRYQLPAPLSYSLNVPSSQPRLPLSRVWPYRVLSVPVSKAYSLCSLPASPLPHFLASGLQTRQT